MKRSFPFHAAASLLLTLALIPALAFATIEGTFWDPTFEGEGWAIEAQNDTAFLTWYTYEADGSPTFRTAVCTYTYEVVSLDDVTVTCSGSLSITQNRTDTTELGPFTAVFTRVEGRLVGQVNANGEERRLEPFNFNYSSSADFLNGVWTVAEISTEETDADTVVFGVLDTVLDDGVTPAKTFFSLDSLGAPGFAYFDEAEDAYVAVQQLPSGERGVARFLSTDDKALGVVFDTDAAGNVTSDPTVIVAASAANTTGEALAFNDLLGVVVRKAAANAKPLTIPMRKISQETFDQARRRMEEAKQE